MDADRNAFVLDASVAIAWVHPSQATEVSELWLSRVASGATLVVPAIWPLEVANALLVLQRRRKLTPKDRTDALAALSAIPVEIDQEASAQAFTSLAELAHHQLLSVHDATYLELAMRRRIPLGCGDGPLRAAARRNHISLDPQP